MFVELLCPFQDGYSPLHLALREGHTTCAERLLFTPGIDVSILKEEERSTKYKGYIMSFYGCHDHWYTGLIEHRPRGLGG